MVWYLVNGIYPNIACFVKTLSVLLRTIQKKYVKWQESKRKSIERAFGVLQRKFQILTRPVELWYHEDICEVVGACIILHNMMVEVHVQRDEPEDEEFYDEFAADDNTSEGLGQQQQTGPQRRVQVDHTADEGELCRENVSSVWPQVGDTEWEDAIKSALEIEFECQKERWDALYNEENHFELRDEIAVVVSTL
jgi:Plant transposon protein